MNTIKGAMSLATMTAMCLADVTQAAPPLVAASSYSSFALDRGGQLWAWGDDGAGQLGQGRVVQSLVPIRAVGGLGGVTTIACGGGFSVATKADGTLWAWGANEGGQLGDGTVAEHSTPEQIGGNYKAVATGHDFTVAIKADGTLWAWAAMPTASLATELTTAIRARYRSAAATVQSLQGTAMP